MHAVRAHLTTAACALAALSFVGLITIAYQAQKERDERIAAMRAAEREAKLATVEASRAKARLEAFIQTLDALDVEIGELLRALDRSRVDQRERLQRELRRLMQLRWDLIHGGRGVLEDSLVGHSPGHALT